MAWFPGGRNLDLVWRPGLGVAGGKAVATWTWCRDQARRVGSLRRARSAWRQGAQCTATWQRACDMAHSVHATWRAACA